MSHQLVNETLRGPCRIAAEAMLTTDPDAKARLLDLANREIADVWQMLPKLPRPKENAKTLMLGWSVTPALF